MKRQVHAVSPTAPATAEPQPEPDTSRILIVDDEGSIRDLFAGVFRPPVYHTLKAADGPSALALAKTNIFDLAFVDRVMPGMDGIEISKRLREIQPALKIVLISGLPDRRPGASGRGSSRAGVSGQALLGGGRAILGRAAARRSWIQTLTRCRFSPGPPMPHKLFGPSSNAPINSLRLAINRTRNAVRA
jgi:CheY-like chemotaxis protein